MLIYGLTGKMRSGKDTLFTIVKGITPDVVRLAFADSLKEEVAKACGVTVEFINDNKDTFRPILQWWGTEFRRKLYGESYWLDRLRDKLDALPENSIVFITDARFCNEADLVRAYGGKVIRTTRLNWTSEIGASHDSETQLERIKPDISFSCGSVEELTDHVSTWWLNNLRTLHLGDCK